MNDSFLEDLNLVSPDAENVNTFSVDRHVTTRIVSSTPLQCIPKTKNDNVMRKVEQSVHPEKQTIPKEPKDQRKISDLDGRKQQMKVKIAERKDKVVESKLKPIENKVKSDGKEQEIKDDMKTKMKESKVKGTDHKVVSKERLRRSGSCKENTVASEVKENNRPFDLAREGSSRVEVTKEKTKAYELHKKLELNENDSTVLGAIKEIVSACTRQESNKILRTMQELHINSQATLIKYLVSQTDDILSEFHPSKESSKVKSLLEMNERLQEENVILHSKNDELQKKLEEMENLRLENKALKLQCMELSKLSKK